MLRTYERIRMFGVLCGVFGGAFLLAALVHMSTGVDLGELSREPRMMELGLLELISGAVLSAAAVGHFARKIWAWKTGMFGHLLGLVTSVIGLLAPQLGFGSLTEVGHMFYLLMLVLLSLSLIAQWQIRPRNPVKRAAHRAAARLY